MSTLQDLRQGLSRAWDGIADGWRDFCARTGDALTRFNPIHRAGAEDDSHARLAVAGNRWGVLAAEVRLDDDSVEVALECPGMDENDFTIDVLDDVLVVRGEKHVAHARMAGRFHVMERAYGSFERALRLPVAVDDSGARARYRRGVLHVTLPRAAHARARKIPVQGA
ncbi:MAG: Hsp20/alpha crystallin family protein [Gammaproteobacteria bacterium]